MQTLNLRKITYQFIKLMYSNYKKIIDYASFIYGAKNCELFKSLIILLITLKLAFIYWLTIRDT